MGATPTRSTMQHAAGSSVKVCRIASLLLIWSSVVLITCGTRLRMNSPSHREELRREMEQLAGSGPGERLNPAGRMSVVVAADFEWVLILGFSGFVATVFTAGVLGIPLMGRRNRDLALLAASVFGLGCCLGSLLGLGQTLGSLRGGFVVLACGFFLSAAGLAVGAFGLVADCALRGFAGPTSSAKPCLSELERVDPDDDGRDYGAG